MSTTDRFIYVDEAGKIKKAMYNRIRDGVIYYSTSNHEHIWYVNDLGQIICVDDNEVFDHDFYNSDFIEEVALKVKDMLKSYDPKTFITPPDYDRHIKRKFIEIYEEAAEMMGIEF